MERLLTILGTTPVETLLQWPFPSRGLFEVSSIVGSMRGDSSPIAHTGKIYRTDGSLEACFLRGYRCEDVDLGVALESFCRPISDVRVHDPIAQEWERLQASQPILRWVVRRGSPDLGLWKTVSPGQLLLPIDTHVGRLAQYVGLTTKRTVGWRDGD